MGSEGSEDEIMGHGAVACCVPSCFSLMGKKRGVLIGGIVKSRFLSTSRLLAHACLPSCVSPHDSHLVEEVVAGGDGWLF